MDRDVLNAIHTDKMNTFLENIGAMPLIMSGKAKCKFCKKQITLGNLNVVFPENKEIKFACDSIECIAKLSSYLTEK